MDAQIIGFMTAHRAMVAEARSAMPDAPVVIERERTPRAGPARASLARGLHRLADALAPAAATPTVASC
jgi:hypothetical protein